MPTGLDRKIEWRGRKNGRIHRDVENCGQIKERKTKRLWGERKIKPTKSKRRIWMSVIWLLTNFISSIWQYVLADLELSGQVVQVLTCHSLLNGHQFCFRFSPACACGGALESVNHFFFSVRDFPCIAPLSEMRAAGRECAGLHPQVWSLRAYCFGRRCVYSYTAPGVFAGAKRLQHHEHLTPSWSVYMYARMNSTIVFIFYSFILYIYVIIIFYIFDIYFIIFILIIVK